MATKKAYTPRKNPIQRMAELASKRGKNGKPLWDLDRDGISYTMLSRFLSCRERFRITYVEGWSESGFQAALEFGSAFHACIENPDSPPEKITRRFQENRLKSKAIFPAQLQEFEVLMAMVEATVYAYREIYSKDDLRSKSFVYQEENFDVEYRLSDYTCLQSSQVRLRGRWDGVYRDNSGKLWLMETKTKSDIDAEGIGRTLAQDLQTMFYVTALESCLNERVEGVLYNVIRRPAYRLGKSENVRDFAVRVKQKLMESVTATDSESRFFMRWSHTFKPGDLKEWQISTLNPLLAQVKIWWDSIKGDPFNPWVSPHHNQRPFGVYDALGSGRRGDFFTLMTGGGMSGLVRRESAFPELT